MFHRRRSLGEVTPAISEDNERVLPMEEARDCRQKSKDVEEVTAVKAAQSTEVEGGFVACETGRELQPVRVKAPPQKRRKGIRAESAATQDYVSGLPGFEELGQEETEELGFVPSSVSEPQWALHSCGNKCREESFKFFQLVAVVTEAGRAAHTLNMCKQCWNERWQKQGEQPVKAARRRELMEQQAFRGI